MSVGPKPNVTELVIPLKVKLKALMQMMPGDPCPDEECDGYIKEVVMTWDMTGLDGHGRCAHCNDKWTVIEQPSYQDMLEETDGNKDKEAS